MKVGESDINKICLNNSEIPKIYLGDTVVYENQPGPTPHDYSKDYLTLRITGNSGVLKFASTSRYLTKTIQYSKDNGTTWTSITSSTAGTQINVSSGDTVLVKGSNTAYATSSYQVGFINSTVPFILEGNIMSLIYGDNFSGQTSLTADYTFFRFFQGCTSLTNIDNVVLPATTIRPHCYRSLFKNCSSLVDASKLILPATTLKDSCYLGMFHVDTSLTKAPKLPATTLVANCYGEMFFSCTTLNYVECLAETNLGNGYTTNWLSNVAATGTFKKSVNSNTWPVDANGIPSGWSIVEI